MKYLHFSSYRLRLGSYSGTVGEGSVYFGLSFHKNQPFSTVDRNRGNLAVMHRGGWWYRSGAIVNLNGLWGEKSIRGVHWTTHYNTVYPVSTEMKVRRLNT